MLMRFTEYCNIMLDFLNKDKELGQYSLVAVAKVV